MLRISWFALVSAYFICPDAVMASAACPDVPGAGALFERPTVRVVWVGEMHGTSEMPALFADLVCVASTTARRVVVALERGADEQPLWDRFLISDGGPAARAALLKGSDWTSPTQDGRNSVAMLALADRLREYKAQGR